MMTLDSTPERMNATNLGVTGGTGLPAPATGAGPAVAEGGRISCVRIAVEDHRTIVRGHRHAARRERDLDRQVEP